MTGTHIEVETLPPVDPHEARTAGDPPGHRERRADGGDAGVLLGRSPALRQVLELVERVAASEASVLICGETGTGKELLARAIHRDSARGDGPFVPVNCAAIPHTLLESELFGHARGAFTDARGPRAGLFVQASGGTLFLDEIGEMPADMQAKILRALQERTVRPVGADSEVPFDARLVTATHRDLEAAVAAGTFRQDLYYRINVVTLPVPPLRERGEDILELAGQFLARASARSGHLPPRLPPAVAAQLAAYTWPGNVRELQNCIERLVALARSGELSVEDLPERVRGAVPASGLLPARSVEEIVSLEEMERRYILRVLELLEGNKSRAAELLGLDRRTLYRRLERYGTAGPEPARAA